MAEGSGRRRDEGPLRSTDATLASESATDEIAAVRAAFAARREDIVRRLLRRGATGRLLGALLPEWSALIQRLEAETERRPRAS